MQHVDSSWTLDIRVQEGREAESEDREKGGDGLEEGQVLSRSSRLACSLTLDSKGWQLSEDLEAWPSR